MHRLAVGGRHVIRGLGHADERQGDGSGKRAGSFRSEREKHAVTLEGRHLFAALLECHRARNVVVAGVQRHHDEGRSVGQIDHTERRAR